MQLKIISVSIEQTDQDPYNTERRHKKSTVFLAMVANESY